MCVPYEYYPPAMSAPPPPVSQRKRKRGREEDSYPPPLPPQDTAFLPPPYDNPLDHSHQESKKLRNESLSYGWDFDDESLSYDLLGFDDADLSRFVDDLAVTSPAVVQQQDVVREILELSQTLGTWPAGSAGIIARIQSCCQSLLRDSPAQWGK
jgi:hypothetical protein